MSNQLENKANQINQILAQYGLNKEAKQTITHKSLLSQDNLGREMTNEIHENEDGVQADTEAAANNSSNKIDAIPNAQNLNTSAQSALADTGSTTEVQTSEGCAAEMPAEQAKSAAYFAGVLQGILDKKAAAQEAAKAEAEDPFCTATDVYLKVASLGPRSTEEDLALTKNMIQKLAAVNPVFAQTRDQYIQDKLVKEAEELAEAAGISPEDAAAAMDAAVAANPEMADELEEEATGEALADLAGAEQETGELLEGAQELADGASQVLGTEVTADDIASALEEVTAMADEMGVEPEVLIQAAAEEIAQGDEPSDEDMANAQELVAMAAEEGISPDQLIEEIAASIDADEAGGGEEAAAEEEPIEKAASLQKQISPRVGYVLEQLRNAAQKQ
jgi:hypothetical protein